MQKRELGNALQRSVHGAPQYDAIGESVRYLYRVWRKRRIGAGEARALEALRRRVRDRISILRHAATSEASADDAYDGLRSTLIEYARLECEKGQLRGGEALRRAVETRTRALRKEPPLPVLEDGPRSGERVANRFKVGPLLAELGDLAVYEGSTDDGERVFVHFCAATIDRGALYLGSVFCDRPGAPPGPGLSIKWEGDHGEAIAFVTTHAERYPVGAIIGASSSSSADVTLMIEHLLEAIDRLHTEGVAHGAIGPSTVLVPHTGIAHGRVALLGLGAFPSAGENARQRDLRGVVWVGACALAGRVVDDESAAIGAIVDDTTSPRLAAWFHRHLGGRMLAAAAMRDELRVSRMADGSDAVPHPERLYSLERASVEAVDRINTWLDRIPPPRGIPKDREPMGDEVAQAVERACVSLNSLDGELGIYLGMVRDMRDGYDRQYRRRGMLTLATMAICAVVAPLLMMDVDWSAFLSSSSHEMSTEPLLGPTEPRDQAPGPRNGRSVPPSER